MDLDTPELSSLVLGDTHYPSVSQLTSLRLACAAIRTAHWTGLPYLAHMELACTRLTRLHLGSCNVMPDSALAALGDPDPEHIALHGCPSLRCTSRGA